MSKEKPTKKESIMWDLWIWCDEHDKSKEFMIACMMEIANATHDEVMRFIKSGGLNGKSK